MTLSGIETTGTVEWAGRGKASTTPQALSLPRSSLSTERLRNTSLHLSEFLQIPKATYQGISIIMALENTLLNVVSCFICLFSDT